MLNIISHQRNTNRNHSEIALHTHQEIYSKKSQIITTVVNKNVEKLKPSNTASGNVNWYNCSGSLAIPQKVKYRVTTYLRNSIPKYIPNRNENRCLQENLYMNAQCSIMHAQVKSGNNSTVHELMNGQSIYGIQKMNDWITL